jgi:hypothetical protein
LKSPVRAKRRVLKKDMVVEDKEYSEWLTSARVLK